MNSRVARDIASTLGVSVDEVLRSLKRENRSTTYRHRDYLVVQAEELSRAHDDPTRIEFSDLYALIGPNHLITISAGPSPAVERVRGEMQRKAVADDEVSSSNYIFTRIFGSIIHRNVDVLNDLEEATRALALNTASSGPRGNSDRDRLARISIVAEQARHPVTATVEVLNALCEERNLFGSTKPRDAIERYRGYQRDMLSKLDFIRTQEEVISRSWRERTLEESNNLLFKLAVATGALAVPGTLFDFLQVPFANGWTDSQMWGAVGASALVSAGLLGYLFGPRILGRFFSRPGSV
jgi:Mg2+ and Co2+ transporter CorA